MVLFDLVFVHQRTIFMQDYAFCVVIYIPRCRPSYAGTPTEKCTWIGCQREPFQYLDTSVPSS